MKKLAWISILGLATCGGDDGDTDEHDHSHDTSGDGDHHATDVTIDTAGSYTLVAYAHIGEGAQGAKRSTPINIEVIAP